MLPVTGGIEGLAIDGVSQSLSRGHVVLAVEELLGSLMELCLQRSDLVTGGKGTTGSLEHPWRDWLRIPGPSVPEMDALAFRASVLRHVAVAVVRALRHAVALTGCRSPR